MSVERQRAYELSYVARVKPYEYRLACGLVFISYTPSVPDDDTGVHFFPCRRCSDWHEYTDAHIPSLQQVPASARDMAFVNRLDTAMVKDRIVHDLLISWDKLTQKIIAARHNVSDRTVRRVLAEMGVSDFVQEDDSLSAHTNDGPFGE